jgi:hypothetical protein
MIIKVRNKLYDSNKETIGIRLNNAELARFAYHYLRSNPPETVIILNGTRKDDSLDDALVTSAESKKFVNDLETYLKKNYPTTYKKVSSMEIA